MTEEDDGEFVDGPETAGRAKAFSRDKWKFVEEINADRALHGRAVRVALALLKHVNVHSRTCWPGMRTVAKFSGLELRTAERGKADLLDRGYFQIVEKGRYGDTTTLAPIFDPTKRAAAVEANERLQTKRTKRSSEAKTVTGAEPPTMLTATPDTRDADPPSPMADKQGTEQVTEQCNKHGHSGLSDLPGLQGSQAVDPGDMQTNEDAANRVPVSIQEVDVPRVAAPRLSVWQRAREFMTAEVGLSDAHASVVATAFVDRQGENADFALSEAEARGGARGGALIVAAVKDTASGSC